MEILTLITGIMLSLTGLFYCGIIGFFTYGWYRRKLTVTVDSKSKRQDISVVISLKNKEDNITGLLNDLLVQDYPHELTEIIVVDDHSTDKTAEKVNDFISKEKGVRFRIIIFDDIHLSGKKAALTLGIKEASGELILTTDGDCRVGKSWISSLVSSFRDDKQMVFGPVMYIPKRGFMNKFQSLEFLGLVASGAGAALAGHPFMCNGANLAYRKSAFRQAKGFEGNEKFISGDDVFLMHKMKKEFGSKAIGFAWDKRSLVQTYPANNLPAFIKQRIRWASKSKGYSDPLAVTTAFIVFIFNFILSATFFAGFCYPGLFLLFTGFLLLKSLIDMPLIWGVTGFTGSRQLMKWYLPFQAIYPFYIVVAGVISVFPRRKW